MRAQMSVQAAALGAAFALLAGAPGVARAASPPSPPSEVISPLPGTPDASPDTQISFLGAPASHLRNILVVGSRSGKHRGRLRFYSTHTGGSFLPARAFIAGETVTVKAQIVGSSTPRTVGTTFTVSEPVTLSGAGPVQSATPSSPDVQHFHSRRDLQPPTVSVTTAAADPALGDVFITADRGHGEAGAMIIAPNGQLVWFLPTKGTLKAFDLNVQSYRAQPVLTWWQGQVVAGHGQGVDEIYSSNYVHIATVRAGNGVLADLHDFVLTPEGSAWITAFAPVRVNLRPFGGSTDGIIEDGVVQEIDVETGLVMFDWHALGHVPISASYVTVPHIAGELFDFFHLNSIDPLSNGTALISARNTWATYLVSETTGNVLWQLGGKHSSFTLGPGVSFAWQHDAELLANDTLTLFNNDASPAEASESSALTIALDPSASTATLVARLTHPGTPILSSSQGDVQELTNGDTFVGWGDVADASQFAPSGQLTFDLHLAPPTTSYRAFRYPWSAQPPSHPAIVASTDGKQTQVYASWNGATNVASWQVLAGSTPGSQGVVGTYPDTGFETSIVAPTAAPYFSVLALSASGTILARSRTVALAHG